MLHSLKVAQLLRSAACLHTNQSRSYLNHLVFTSKFVGTGPLSYKKRIYRAAVSRKLRNTVLEDLNYFRTLISTYSNELISVVLY